MWKALGQTCLVLLGAVGLFLPHAPSACCYFSAKDKDILQPAQKVFLTWDPVEKVETFTVQPKFEGNALDFGMVIPTPARPKLDEMPRDFFKELAYYTILKRREMPQSKLLNLFRPLREEADVPLAARSADSAGGLVPRTRPVVVLEAGVVGNLDYKIIAADDAQQLYQWLKDNQYHYAGDEATLEHYIKKKWLFTVMKIDTKQMKRNPDGSFAGEITPTRFQFVSEQLVYPLKITQLSVKDKTEALFYVQAPYKVDLQGDFSYQYNWVAMLQAASGCTPGGLPGYGGDWLTAVKDQSPALAVRSKQLGFNFVSGQRPVPNAQCRTPCTMEWAKRLTPQDIQILKDVAFYSEQVPDVDAGFTEADCKDPKRAEAVFKAIQLRLDKCHKDRPFGYLVRHAPPEDVRQLRILLGHLQQGMFLTKFRKVFTRLEMNDDLVIVQARLGQAEDRSEYEEMLPTSPP